MTKHQSPSSALALLSNCEDSARYSCSIADERCPVVFLIASSVAPAAAVQKPQCSKCLPNSAGFGGLLVFVRAFCAIRLALNSRLIKTLCDAVTSVTLCDHQSSRRRPFGLPDRPGATLPGFRGADPPLRIFGESKPPRDSRAVQAPSHSKRFRTYFGCLILPKHKRPPAASVRNPFQVMAHDWSRGLAASHGSESEAPERGNRTGEHIGRAGRQRSVDRICFQCRRIGAFGSFQCLGDQSRHNAPSAIPAPDIETGDGPDRHIVDSLESLLAVEPAQILSWHELTPTDRPLAFKGQQSWWGTLLHDSMECALILLSQSLVIFRADPPILAPATIAGATLAEKGLQGGPERGRKRSNCELHVAAFRLFLWGPSKHRTCVSASHSRYF